MLCFVFLTSEKVQGFLFYLDKRVANGPCPAVQGARPERGVDCLENSWALKRWKLLVLVSHQPFQTAICPSLHYIQLEDHFAICIHFIVLSLCTFVFFFFFHISACVLLLGGYSMLLTTLFHVLCLSDFLFFIFPYLSFYSFNCSILPALHRYFHVSTTKLFPFLHLGLLSCRSQPSELRISVPYSCCLIATTSGSRLWAWFAFSLTLDTEDKEQF